VAPDAAVWNKVAKNGDDIPPMAEVRLLDDAEAKYISRGGLKLEGASGDGLVVKGLRCLDVGQSTGGFTDCLLQHGAAQVIGVDVGHGQLHERLRDDPRVVGVEGLNARAMLTAESLLEGCDAASEEGAGRRGQRHPARGPLCLDAQRRAGG
jgi:23S rRNA (cytidine1920-2'-O)/16S rRNA (cytidine1409-2'-O)-methyltransferase